MKKISELVAGDQIEHQPLLIGQVKEGFTQAGQPYLTMSLEDSSGSLDTKLWDVKSEQKEICRSGRVVSVTGVVLQYRNQLQLKVLDVQKCEESVDPRDFLPSGQVDAAELKKYIRAEAESIRDPVLHDLVKKLLEEAGEEFYQHPAASKNHHEFHGGLAAHVREMCLLAEAILPLYPLLDRDLLISGVLVHDIGKMEELDAEMITSYTMEGKLLGHISIGMSMVRKAAAEMGVEGQEKVILLEHMILSHHGQLEFGSPVMPMTPEAEALHFLDNFDARMEILRKEMSKTKEGEFTPRLYPMENRMFYKEHRQEEK